MQGHEERSMFRADVLVNALENSPQYFLFKCRSSNYLIMKKRYPVIPCDPHIQLLYFFIENLQMKFIH